MKNYNFQSFDSFLTGQKNSVTDLSTGYGLWFSYPTWFSFPGDCVLLPGDYSTPSLNIISKFDYIKNEN